MDRKKITLDLTNCKYLMELHRKIKIAFDFPEWYGNNYDAFWDLLRSECTANEVIIKGVNTVSEELNEAIKIIIEILDRYTEERYKICRIYNDAEPFNYIIE